MDWLGECERSMGRLGMAINGWASVAINWRAVTGDQSTEKNIGDRVVCWEWRYLCRLGMAIMAEQEWRSMIEREW